MVATSNVDRSSISLKQLSMYATVTTMPYQPYELATFSKWLFLKVGDPQNHPLETIYSKNKSTITSGFLATGLRNQAISHPCFPFPPCRSPLQRRRHTCACSRSLLRIATSTWRVGTADDALIHQPISGWWLNHPYEKYAPQATNHLFIQKYWLVINIIRKLVYP